MKYPYIPFEKLRWNSDWNGEEIGYDDVAVVGLYSWDDQNIDMYIDMEEGIILEIWSTEEEEE